MSEPKIFKVLLVGESSVGKTCLLLRYTENKYSDFINTTIGVDFKTKILQVEGNQIKLQIWDSAGAEKYRSITKAYYRGSHGILVVFDLTSKDSFNQLQFWIDSIKQDRGEDVDIVIVGNKNDLQHQVDLEDILAFTEENGLNYFNTSAKDNTNVDEVFQYLALQMYKRSHTINQKEIINNFNIDNKNVKKEGGCC